MRYPKFFRGKGRRWEDHLSSEWIEGSVYDVGCPCGHIVLRVCLAQGASAIVCPSCKQELALPSFEEDKE